MEYYCIMVKTGAEQSFKERAAVELKNDFPDIDFFFFKHTLKSNRGEYFEKPIFPGYIFLQIETLSVEFLSRLVKLKNFYRILRDNSDPTKITGESLNELKIFIHNGEHWGVSKVKVLPGMKVKAVSGPFMGLEGLVYKINRKKKVITIISSLTSDGKKIDLLYEDVGLTEEKAEDKSVNS